MKGYITKIIWVVTVFTDPNKGWGSQDLYLVDNKKLADKIASKMHRMDGARVEKRTLIVGEKRR